ncbi:MAG: hypothetical protein JSV37_07690 [Anaerolineaceae bacterium]|nr:MAG: hypothetical protein JSV37_07690 [Anaerolineaceae bacterium]
MNRRRFFLGALITFLVLLMGLGILYVLMPKMGYCFGTAVSETGDRVLVTAGYRGLHSFEITREGELVLHSTVYDGGYYRYVELLGHTAYVANSHRGLMILDVSEDEPAVVWSQSDSKAYGVHLQPPLAYVAAEKDGLFIFDVSAPEGPKILGRVSVPGRAWDVWVEGNHAFVADADSGLVVIDVSSPGHPQVVSTLTWDPESSSAEIIDGRDGTLYIASGEFGLMVVDVGDPLDPLIAYRYDPGPDSYGEGVRVYGDTLYVTIEDGSHPEENGLHVFNIEDPLSPTLVRKIPVSDFVEAVSIGGNHLAIANTQSGVLLYDIQIPHNPHLLTSYPSAFWRMLTSRLRW